MSNINSDLLDDGLQAVMGKDRCQNEWTAPKKKTEDKKLQKTEPTRNQTEDSREAPVKPKLPMDKLKECAKWSVIFGGISSLLFYWQQAGLLDSSAAVPSLIACALLAGLAIGWNAK